MDPERRLAAQHAVAVVLAEAPSLEGAARRVLEIVCRTEGWPLGLFWVVDRAAAALRCRWLFSEEDLDGSEFVELSRRLPIPSGMDLVGRAWSEERPLWIDDAGLAPGSPRESAAAKSGLGAGCAFPVRDGGVYGVVELYARAPAPVDRGLLGGLEDIGRLLGEFVQLRRVETELHRTEEHLRAVLSHAPIILFAIDRQHHVTLSEGRALEALGLRPGQLVGALVDDLYPDLPELLGNLHRALAGEAFTEVNELPGEVFLETRFYPRRDESGAVVEVVGVSIDISERVHAERRMVEADRLAAVGTLAGGLAHEINNPLTYALLNLSRAVHETDPTRTGLVEMLAEARSGLERVAGVVQDLSALTRTEPGRRPIDLTKTLESVVGTTGNLIRRRARLVTSFGPVPLVDGGEARLAHAFHNLLSQAARAVPEGEPERHEVRLRTLTDEQGRAVVIVSDSGAGLSPADLRRVFDPYYRGAGLGLSICRRIIHDLGGRINVESEVGRGTSFVVTLPPSAGMAGPARPGARKRPRVLVVDDEPALAQAIADAISDQCDVETVTSGRGALARIEAGRDYDLILCDLLMPMTTGMAVYAAVAEARPELAERMVFMTGGRHNPEASAFAAGMAGRILDKPFDLAVLQALVRSRLGLDA